MEPGGLSDEQLLEQVAISRDSEAFEILYSRYSRAIYSLVQRVLRDQVRQGRTDAEIKHYLTDRYGEFVLLKPRFEQRTWLLWLPLSFLGFPPAMVAIVWPAADTLETNTW